mgnify:FL=1
MMNYNFNEDMRIWADTEGERYPERAWLLSSADTWHKNPYYKGEPKPHPECYEPEDIGENYQEPDEEIKVKELENGNGYTYALVIGDAEKWEAPNEDIGETWENKLGYSTKEEALNAGRNYAEWMADRAKICQATGEWPSKPYG